MRSGNHTRRHAAIVAVVGLVLAACGPHDNLATSQRVNPAPDAPYPAAAEVESTPSSPWSVAAPTRLKTPLSPAHVLVLSGKPLPRTLLKRVRRLDEVRHAAELSLASVPVADRSITVAGVAPDSYRRFTAPPTAKMDAVWRAVAAGDVAVSHRVAEDLDQTLGGTLTIRHGDGVPLRIGAYATTLPQIHAVVNDRRRIQLGMRRGNALLVSIDRDTAAVTQALRRMAGKGVTVQTLRPRVPKQGATQLAYLTGGAVARAVGTFSYRQFPDGTVQPQASWVAANIRSSSMPMLGKVTCHRVMLPQLRSALAEIVERGLGNAIDPRDYGGCYVPRFIGHDPRRGLSLHTWGIAIDLNVSGNQRGTTGQIDRRVVAIFKKWGFAWGGDWEWTDPMHFELAALVR